MNWRKYARLRDLVEFENVMRKLEAKTLHERIDLLEQAVIDHLSNEERHEGR